ncbi:hypothetical protein Ciccas_000937 [Cichlidogyrus casuarinus]|uniref:C3H1-type domain-containing protein n=1 Tax=Cichlidogyrus casuarinus TaxID=1844966 RepID=A0ABD2QMM0_9PLAT
MLNLNREPSSFLALQSRLFSYEQGKQQLPQSRVSAFQYQDLRNNCPQLGEFAWRELYQQSQYSATQTVNFWNENGSKLERTPRKKSQPFAPRAQTSKSIQPRLQDAIYNARYKTQLCVHFDRNGKCPLGVNCHFAHGQQELGMAHEHPKYKTRPCKNYYETGFCDFGHNCFFQHIRPGQVGPQ